MIVRIAVVTKQTPACIKVTTPNGSGMMRLSKAGNDGNIAGIRDVHGAALDKVVKKLFRNAEYTVKICERMPGDARAVIWILEHEENEK